MIPQKWVLEFCDPPKKGGGILIPPSNSLVPPAVVNDVSLLTNLAFLSLNFDSSIQFNMFKGVPAKGSGKIISLAYMLQIRSYNDLIINKIPTRWPCKKDSSKTWFITPVKPSHSIPDSSYLCYREIQL